MLLFRDDKERSMQGEFPGVSVVVPVYKSAESLRTLFERIVIVLEPLGDFEVIFVDDGSPKETWTVIQDLSLESQSVVGLRLGRNYGQHSALVAGVRAATKEIIVTLDDDLQNPPEEIPILVSYLRQNHLDVVYGVPERTAQPLFRRLAGIAIRKLLGSGLGADSAQNLSSFRVFRTDSREAFGADLGVTVSLDAILTWGNSRFGTVTVKHDVRSFGRSNYSLRKLIRHSVDTITGYSAVPLQLASLLGFVTSLFGFGVLIYVVAIPLMSGQSVQGFPFLASTIAIFAGVQLLTLGVLGEYLARMHFRIMRKPTYFIAEMTQPNEAFRSHSSESQESQDPQ
jgi:glycosyltransferase involved in cell wall biosynthesis